MSRLYTRNSRGRQPMLGSTTKLSKPSKKHPNDTYQPNGKKSKPVRKFVASKRVTSKRKRVDSPASDGDSSSTLEYDSADEASDEADGAVDEDDDLPAVVAPSHSQFVNEAGRKSLPKLSDNISVAGSIESMFGDLDDYFEEGDDPNLSPEENRKRFEETVFAESDEENDGYQGVDDISDSDDDLDEQHIQHQELLAMLPEEEISDANFLNQIDGLSAYGFGDESDGSIPHFPSSQSGDSATEAATERRVHFAAEQDMTFLMRMSQSPTITRALLPSALPDFGSLERHNRRSAALIDDLDDSDLTDDCLPAEALQNTGNQAEEERESSAPPTPRSKKGKKAVRRRGPPRGIFIDEGDKTSGILDSSGKIILMTNPHLLGEEFARRYGTSQTSSPDVGFAELIDESDAGDTESLNFMAGQSADIMLASLNSALNDPSNLGQPTGPLEAFYPADFFLANDFGLDQAGKFGDDDGEDVMSLRDVISFGSDSEDSDSSTSPMAMTPNQSFMGKDFSHLNSGNVTAFRQNADPAMARMNIMSESLNMHLTSSPLATPRPPKRRKRAHASPYHSSHYHGVTPVQRMLDPNHGRTPDLEAPAKKRRLMT